MWVPHFFVALEIKLHWGNLFFCILCCKQYSINNYVLKAKHKLQELLKHHMFSEAAVRLVVDWPHEKSCDSCIVRISLYSVIALCIVLWVFIVLQRSVNVLHLQLTGDQLASMPAVHTMAKQVINIKITDDVRERHSIIEIFWHLNVFLPLRDLCFLFFQGRILLGEKEAPLETKDIIASNGVIHLIDGVLVPSSIVPILPHRCDANESKIIQVSVWQSMNI